MPRPGRAACSGPGSATAAPRSSGAGSSRERVALDEAFVEGALEARGREEGPGRVPAPRLVGVGRPARGGRRPVRGRRGRPDPDARDGEEVGPDRGPVRPAASPGRGHLPQRRADPQARGPRAGDAHPLGQALGGAVGRRRRDRDVARPDGRPEDGFLPGPAGPARGRRQILRRTASVLDAFCNQGSFALHAAKAGASRVLGLDSAPRPSTRPAAAPSETASAPSSRSPTSSTGSTTPANKAGPRLGRGHPRPAPVREVEVGARGRA